MGVMHPLVSTVQGLEVASAANEAAKDETVNASSTSDGYSSSSYKCHLPLNCYAGHGADKIDYIEGASMSACAEACNEMWQCEGFVYMGTQRKCWRRRNINLPACERGQWNTESSEFITCLKPSCKPQGQSCESSGDCCDDNVCKSFVGGKGKVCVAPPPPPCVAPGARCSPTCPGCPVQQCCGGSACQALHHGDDFVCVL